MVTKHLGPGLHPNGTDQSVHAGRGTMSLEAILASTPRRPGEQLFDWQSRVLNKLPRQTKHEVLSLIRERYAPVDSIEDAASQYRRTHGIPEPRVDWDAVQADIPKADKVAKAYLSTPSQHNDPRVRAAYADFVSQTDEMFDLITRPKSEGGMGIKVEFVETDSPYDTAEAQAEDVRRNGRIKIGNGVSFVGTKGHPLMTHQQYAEFRAVHDVFGHVGIGGGFDRHGEYSAYLAHSAMYTGEGRKAMASEYHGINSVVWAGGMAPEWGVTYAKAILLPDDLTQNPFDDMGNWVRKDMAELQDFIDTLGLDADFLAQYENLHRRPRRQVQKIRKADMPKYELTIDEIDEVSLVPSGDNPDAHVVLSKADPNLSKCADGKHDKGSDGKCKHCKKVMKADPDSSDVHLDAPVKVQQDDCYDDDGDGDCDSCGVKMRNRKMRKRNVLDRLFGRTGVDKCRNTVEGARTLPTNEESDPPEDTHMPITKEDLPGDLDPKVTEFIESLEAATAEAVKKADEATAKLTEGTKEPEGAADLDEVLKTADPAVRDFITKMKADNEEAMAKAAAAESMAKAEQTRREMAEATDICKGFAPIGVKDDFAATVQVLKSAMPNEWAAVQKVLDAAVAAIKEGKVFEEVGKTGEGTTGDSAWSIIKAEADAIVKADPKTTLAQAIDTVVKANPDLYNQHLTEQKGA